MQVLDHKNGSNSKILPRSENQAILIARYAIDFLKNGSPSTAVLERTKLFHTDALLCGLSAIAQKTNAPTVLRTEALQYAIGTSNATSVVKGYARVFGSEKLTIAEKAIAANCAAVREWDSNGTVFGFR